MAYLPNNPNQLNMASGVPNAFPLCQPSSPDSSVPAVNPNPDIKITLENDDLWKKFHGHSTEMIVTKSGRRMFPTLRYKVSGLEPTATYAIFLELAAADDCRYKFQNGRWIVAGRAEPAVGNGANNRSRMYAHPDSPAPGRIWMRQALSFHRIKLTNNVMDPQGHVLLNSMHKYQPRVYVMRLHDYFPSVPQLVATVAYPETQFIAVTAYQNDKVIQLKIDHNPFAKGFRDNGIQAQSAAFEHRKRSSDGEINVAPSKQLLLSPSHTASPVQCPASSSTTSLIQSNPSKSAFTSALLLASPSSSSSGRSTSSASSSNSTSSNNVHSPKNTSTNSSIWNPLNESSPSTSSPIKPVVGMGTLPEPIRWSPNPMLATLPLMPDSLDTPQTNMFHQMQALLQHNYYAMIMGMSGAAC